MKERISFKEWIAYVFDHPVTLPRWYHDIHTEYEYWSGSADLTVWLLTETFERSGEVLSAYTDAQVEQGLYFLIDPGCSDYVFRLNDESVPWQARQRCIRAIYTLFAQCLAKRCSPHLSHLDEPSANPLNGICYMWWDIFPLYAEPDNPALVERDAEFLEVMRRMLWLPSDACREGALHGLGHWQLRYPHVTGIINTFLLLHPLLRPALRSYALRARHGAIQ